MGHFVGHYGSEAQCLKVITTTSQSTCGSLYRQRCTKTLGYNDNYAQQQATLHLEFLKRQHVHGVHVAEEVRKMLTTKVHHILPASQSSTCVWGGGRGSRGPGSGRRSISLQLQTVSCPNTPAALGPDRVHAASLTCKAQRLHPPRQTRQLTPAAAMTLLPLWRWRFARTSALPSAPDTGVRYPTMSVLDNVIRR